MAKAIPTPPLTHILAGSVSPPKRRQPITLGESFAEIDEKYN